MTDTVTCENCGTALPTDAAFCTNCGTKLNGEAVSGSGASSSPTSAATQEDATRIETPGLHDPTQVLPQSHSAQTPQPQDATQVAAAPAPSGWTPPPVPSQSPWQPPPTAAPQPGAWQPPPPPQPEWAREAPASDQAWGAPSVPSAPPNEWMQPVPGQAPPAAAATAARGNNAAGLAAAVAFVGAIVLVIGVFTLWLQSAEGSAVKLTGWEMVTKGDEAGPLKSPDPAILLGIAAAAIGVAGLLVAGKNKMLMRLLLALAGIGAAVVLVRDYFSIKDAVKHAFDSGTTIDFQYGFWVAAAGAVILIVAAIVPMRKQAEPAR